MIGASSNLDSNIFRFLAHFSGGNTPDIVFSSWPHGDSSLVNEAWGKTKGDVEELEKMMVTVGKKDESSGTFVSKLRFTVIEQLGIGALETESPMPMGLATRLKYNIM